jgi:hypothetical protein
MTGIHPQNRCLGHTRVSTYGQTLDTQLDQLRIFRRFVADAVGVGRTTRKNPAYRSVFLSSVSANVRQNQF